VPGERFDDSNERQRHEKFVGREALLARLDELLVDAGADRWVVVTGGPGMGKSAIRSAWLTRREGAGAVVRMFWESAAGPFGLDTRFVEEAVARAGGNVQHAVQLRRHVAAMPVQLRRVEDIPRGLGALLERTWERIAHDAVVVEGLGILCVAREALTLDELGADRDAWLCPPPA
jgi:hypothetical protein